MNAELYQMLKPEIDRLNEKNKTLSMSTIDEQGRAYTSYTPFVCIDGNYYIFITELAPHTQHILRQPDISIMVIDDESKSKNVFARVRVLYYTKASQVSRTSEEGVNVLQILQDRCGNTMNVLKQLSDFILFKLTPTSGRLVTGFGKAYELDAASLKALHLTEETIKKTA